MQVDVFYNTARIVVLGDNPTELNFEDWVSYDTPSKPDCVPLRHKNMRIQQNDLEQMVNHKKSR